MGARTVVLGFLVPETEKTGLALSVSHDISGDHATWSDGVHAVRVPDYAGASSAGGFAAVEEGVRLYF